MSVSRRQAGVVAGVAALGAMVAGASWQLGQGHASTEQAKPGPLHSPNVRASNPPTSGSPDARQAGERQGLLAYGTKVLFQGDSITDSGRDRAVLAPNVRRGLGNGYAWLVASGYLTSRPGHELRFLNRGVSGNVTADLARRWSSDTLALAPDVVSILVGVNDYWNRHRVLGYKGSPDQYHSELGALVARTRAALPQVDVVMCEPFLLPAGPVTPAWQRNFSGYRQAAADLALANGLRFVGFQSVLDAGLEWAPPRAWCHDGIHPTADGAAVLAREWVRVVGW